MKNAQKGQNFCSNAPGLPGGGGGMVTLGIDSYIIGVKNLITTLRSLATNNYGSICQWIQPKGNSKMRKYYCKKDARGVQFI